MLPLFARNETTYKAHNVASIIFAFYVVSDIRNLLSPVRDGAAHKREERAEGGGASRGGASLGGKVPGSRRR